MLLLILSLASFLISLLTVALIRKRFSQQLLDIPNDRSSHTQPTPRGGGLGFIIALVITSSILAAIDSTSIEILPLWLVLIPLAIIGIIDDRQGVPAAVRYLVQLSSASIAIAFFHPFPQPWLTNLGIAGEIIGIVLTVIGMTALINFYNFMDGLDGLVGGCSAVQLGFLAIYLHQSWLWLLVAAIVGFLRWNWSPAKIFMGDAGSTVLGATVAIALLNTNNNTLQAWSALVVTFPLVIDAVYTICRRLMRRENIFKAHRSHLYQRLQQSGWSHDRVAITYISITFLIASSISIFGAIGALCSVVCLILALVLGEIYLQSKNRSNQLTAS
jgi:UDP-N-acetylmuramyl pentapeptide phosphotransferase/UDP-N-acetylglucosamine-1-phosphate transferase